jgi:ABC-2 type transport system permease protein
MNAGTLLLGICMLLLGFLFYGFLAGLAGATVSKVEELAEGMKLFSFVVVLGVYLVLGLLMVAATGNEPEIYSMLVYYLPFSSVFIVPAYVIIGKITVQTALISMAILLASGILLAFFVTKVFEHVLYHNGSVMKLKEILAVFKNSRNTEVGK